MIKTSDKNTKTIEFIESSYRVAKEKYPVTLLPFCKNSVIKIA